jgi:hypothetical protein
VWKADQRNAMVQARLDQAREETLRLADRVVADADYLTGFARGVERARQASLGDCHAMASRDVASYVVRESEPADSRRRGFEDGQRLILGLELMRGLPACFVPVPEAPPPPRVALPGR